MAKDEISKTFQVTEPIWAVDLLSSETGLSKSTIKEAMIKGAVWIRKSKKMKRLRKAKTLVDSSDKLSIHYSPKVLDEKPITPTLMQDHNVFSVWNKPAGLMSGGSRYGDHCAINRVVERQLDRPTFLVHRLDRFVWGVIVLAHSKMAATELSRQFQSRETEKVYKALVSGQIKEARVIDRPIDGKDARSKVIPISGNDNLSLVEIRIETGRKHQIRRHLSDIGHPIIGDRQYGSADPNGIQLASVALGFKNLEGKFVRYILPEELHPKLLNER